MEDLVSITVTAEDAEDLATIAHALVSERLAACANITPGIRSIYRWDGSIYDGTEAFAILHTRAALVEQVFERVRDLHPYQTPQLIALPIVQVDQDYAVWVCDSTTAAY